MKNVVFLLVFFLTSCANYVNSLHRQIDREDRANSKGPSSGPKYQGSQYWHKKFRPDQDRRPIQNPITLSQSGQVAPPVKREYRPSRYSANDFKDNGSDGSLWANQGSSASLFTYQNDKRAGDIVIINVMENLRNQISAELKRTFPDRPKRKKEDDSKKKKTAAAPAPAAPKDQDDMDMKVYDKISGTVMEEISQDYILLRGQKEVIFKKEKRAIEVQALVSRRDIMENDYVNSDKLLESRVYIIRERQ